MEQAARIEQVETVDGARIGFTRVGRGEPVLLVHGTISSGAGWALVTPHLEGDFTVVTMDRRGRGASSDGSAPHSLELEASDVGAVIDALGEPVHIVGHSFGAVVALLAAARSPSVRSVTLYEPMLAPERLPVPIEDAGERVEALLRAGDPSGAAAYWLDFLTEVELFRPEEVAALRDDPAVWERFVAAVPTVPREVRAGGNPRVVRETVPEIEVPVLTLVGDGTTTPAVLEGLDELEQALPDARREAIPDQWHLANGFAPEALAERIVRFVAGPGRRAARVRGQRGGRPGRHAHGNRARNGLVEEARTIPTQE